MLMKRWRSWGLIMNRQQAIEALEKLADKWPSGISLFSLSGTLVVINDDRKILAKINIPSDGGDPGTERRKDGEYLCK